MPHDSEVWQALLRKKGLTVAELAARLGATRQHAHRLLTGRRRADQRREDIDRALALGRDRAEGRPAYALAVLSAADGELELLPAGDAQPLFGDRDLATHVANALADRNGAVCVVPVWPDYAWRRLVAFHAAWGTDPEPRRIFLVDDPTAEVPVELLLEELRAGFADTLRLRRAAEDPASLREVDGILERLN
jgi:transcriptional regulator with XRE-family HTH domain